jgi:Tfp pilus assembly protein PilF
VESLRLDSRNAEARDANGTVLAQEANLVDAECEFTEALRLRPGYRDAHANLRHALARQGKPDEAVRHWEMALQFDPNNQTARRALEHIRGGGS